MPTLRGDLVFCRRLIRGAVAAEHVVRDARELRQAIARLKPGDVLKIALGTYPGDNYVKGVANLTVTALDPQWPPRFRGRTRER